MCDNMSKQQVHKEYGHMVGFLRFFRRSLYRSGTEAQSG